MNARPPAPKAGDLLNFPSIESGIYGACLLEVVEMTSYNSRYIAPLHFLRKAFRRLTETSKWLSELWSAPALAAGGLSYPKSDFQSANVRIFRRVS